MPPSGFLAAIGSSLAGVGGWLPPAAAATPDPSPAALAAQSIRRLGLQATLPTPQPPSEWSLHLADWLVLSIAIAAVGILLYCLKDLRWHMRGTPTELAAPEVRSAAIPSAHLARAEQFARQDSFAEAMHELLLQGLGDMRAAASGRLADSLTSREILRTTQLPEQGRGALRAMIARVEWSWFGEHAASRADYHACRESFDVLRASLRQAPA